MPRSDAETAPSAACRTCAWCERVVLRRSQAIKGSRTICRSCSTRLLTEAVRVAQARGFGSSSSAASA